MHRLLKATPVVLFTLIAAACTSTVTPTTPAASTPPPPASSPADPGAVASGKTEVIIVEPFNDDGTKKAEYSVDDAARRPVDCSSGLPSDSGVTPGTYMCGGTSDSAYACFAAGEESLLCLYSAMDETLYLYEATGIAAETPVPDEPLPLNVELADGTIWDLRQGGSWNFTPEGTTGMYDCHEGSCPDDAGLTLVQVDGQPVFNESGDVWTAHQAESGTDPATLPAPTTVEVVRVWFIGDGPIN